MQIKRLLKYAGIFLTVLIVFLGLTIPSYNWMRDNVKSARDVHNSRLSPVIFIPGSDATVDRFDNLFSELNSSTTKHSVIKITVQKNNTLTVTGKLMPRDLQPFFVVGFKNNSDGYDNIKKQAKWFDVAMKYLRKHYYFNNFSGVGHSNGGLIYTLYLEKYFSSDDLGINTLITIATPFNFNEADSEKKTQMLANMVDDRKSIPKNLVMYSIAGSTNFTDDGIVPWQSVEAGKYIYQDQVKNYTQITVTGSKSDHSDLVQNPQVVQIIRSNALLNNLRIQNQTDIPPKHHPQKKEGSSKTESSSKSKSSSSSKK
ncbi:alpha/beta hydrolase [Xylocopilactobacillus apis]|uniref:Acyltransferase n=1 Tax=Xylocopilactobacillus apis TaxID=2932183 RepID=A0AAU9DKH6_9LACO|nr:alpha/beta hydrolase [Xylocopilactobacillus apis]BDR57342.1 acyltransferase [Xylocopilactobacillus apis]